jgi:hypothetical protein
MPFTTANANRPSKLLSAIANDPRRLAGISGRSETGRRFRDLLHIALEEFDGVDLSRVRELAVLRLAVEQAQSAVIKGDLSASEDLVRISNLIGRRERDLRVHQLAAHRPPTLSDHIAKRVAESAENRGG